MKYFVALYVTAYRTKIGGKCWETEIDPDSYARVTGTFGYLILDGRLSQDNARMLARQWAVKHAEAKDIIIRKAESFSAFLDSLPDTIPSGRCVTKTA